MRDNIVFYNVAVQQNEVLVPYLVGFLRDEMKMLEHTLKSVYLRRAHRIGKPLVNFARPIVAVFEHEGVNTVMNHARNLRKPF